MTADPEPWSADKVDDLVALCDTAMSGEHLTADELAACCFDDPGVVLGTPDADAAIALCTRELGDRTVAFVKLLAVVPAAQRTGLGRSLLATAVDWARAADARALAIGGSAPFYLWPGIDVRMTAMLALAESAHFTPGAVALNMSAPTTFRAPGPDGMELRRALGDDDEAATIALCCAHWPHWEAELRRGLEQGSCLVAASSSGEVTGFACHSVNRAGWVGPIATDPAHQHKGIAAGLMSEVCRDLAVAGHVEAEISWVGPIGFYSKAMGASVSRTCVTYQRSL
jgi:predicted N-acetyltransferase YhbS